MAKIQEQPTRVEPWNLKDPMIRSELRKLETEINAYEGPWKWEQWLLDHGHIRRDEYFSVEDYQVPAQYCEKFSIPAGTVYRKVNYSAVKNATDIFLKHNALRKMQAQIRWAKKQNEIPPPLEP